MAQLQNPATHACAQVKQYSSACSFWGPEKPGVAFAAICMMTVAPGIGAAVLAERAWNKRPTLP